MCNLYAVTKGQQAMRDVTRAMTDRTGNLPPLPDIFPDYPAPTVRNTPDGRELTMARWGMPSPAAVVRGKNSDPVVTNVRNVSFPHWRRWLGAESCCVYGARRAGTYSSGGSPPTLLDTRRLKLAMTRVHASAAVQFHVEERPSMALVTSAARRGRRWVVPNGPSVSVNTRSGGMAATASRPRWLLIIGGPTENQQPTETARSNSALEPVNQCRTATPAPGWRSSMSITSLAARRLWIVMMRPPAFAERSRTRSKTRTCSRQCGLLSGVPSRPTSPTYFVSGSMASNNESSFIRWCAIWG